MDELVVFLSNKLGIACEYVENNFNEILDSYAKYKITSNVIAGITCILFIFFTIAYIIICCKSRAKGSKYHDVLYEKFFDNYELCLGPSFILGISIAVSIIAIVILIYSIINILGWSITPLMKLVEIIS